MSVIYLLAALWMAHEQLEPAQYFMIEWALFAIADAAWVQAIRR